MNIEGKYVAIINTTHTIGAKRLLPQAKQAIIEIHQPILSPLIAFKIQNLTQQSVNHKLVTTIRKRMQMKSPKKLPIINNLTFE